MFNEALKLTVPVNEKDHTQGASTAKITIVEYGDYQCPYCGKAYYEIKQLQEKFGEDLCLVFRNFPLANMHEHAFHAAEAAEIASDYNKFWEMHDLLFENQEYLADKDLAIYADKLGINPEEFVSQLLQNTKTEKVKADFLSGAESGVNGTPSFFVNGIKYSGAWDYRSFSEVLQKLFY